MQILCRAGGNSCKSIINSVGTFSTQADGPPSNQSGNYQPGYYYFGASEKSVLPLGNAGGT